MFKRLVFVGVLLAFTTSWAKEYVVEVSTAAGSCVQHLHVPVLLQWHLY